LTNSPLHHIPPPTASGKMLEDLLIIGEKRCITTGCHFLVNFCIHFSLFSIYKESLAILLYGK
jgi:hypothetical protein